MNTAIATRYEIDVEDVEYVRHGGKPLLARLYKPRGAGPFPMVVSLHGGAWTKKDRVSDVSTNEPMARSGILVMSLDFRMPPEAKYPGSLQDVNRAVRWCKEHAQELRGRADAVGILGVSSGGHQAMLAALRPRDPRYATLPGRASVDAAVRYVVLCWPVIDPLGRYQYAKKKVADGVDVKQASGWIADHDQYWAGEAEMTEGNPTMALERGENTPLLPVIYLQGTADPAHPRPNLDRFVAAYRKAGGRVDLHFFEGMSQAFITDKPEHPQSLAAIEKIIEFVHREAA
jgi:acetyl esterase